MSMIENAATITENVPKVYEAGQKSEYDRFWDNYQQNGTRRNYAYAFAGQAWASEILNPKYPIRFNDSNANTRHACGMFFWHGRGLSDYVLDLSTLDIDFSGCKSLYQTFANARVDNITIDGSNLLSMNSTFSASDGGNTITTINLKVTETCTDFLNAFNSCTKLTNLTFTDDSVIAGNISLAQSNLLSAGSVNSIINALKDFTGLTARTVTFHTDIVANLTETQLQQISEKNWQVG